MVIADEEKLSIFTAEIPFKVGIPRMAWSDEWPILCNLNQSTSLVQIYYKGKQFDPLTVLFLL